MELGYRVSLCMFLASFVSQVIASRLDKMNFLVDGSGGSDKTICQFKAVIFDCDGVIFDTNSLKTRAFREALQDVGIISEHQDEFIIDHLADVSISRYVKFAKFFERAEVRSLSSHPSWKKSRFVKEALESYGNHCRILYSNLDPDDSALKMAKRVPQAWVISGGSQEELREVFKEKGIARYFRAIYGSPSTKVEHLKRIMAEENLLPTEILFIGDGWTDFKTCVEVGTSFCFLRCYTDWAKADEQISSETGKTTVTDCNTWDEILSRIVD